jgi:hypothetical protein
MESYKEYGEIKRCYQQYSEIKQLVDEFFVMQEKKKYEDFIKKLVMILRL